VTEEWRKVHNEELRNLYVLFAKCIVIGWRRMWKTGHVARKGEKRNEYRLSVGKPDGKRVLGRASRMWGYWLDWSRWTSEERLR
jgi:hypothetical protein